MKIFLLLVFFMSPSLYAQELEVSWSASFQKELTVSCHAGEPFCEQLCKAASFCKLSEGFCRNCIGTGIEIYTLLQEIGQTIRAGGAVSDSGKLIDFLKSGRFVTFEARDAYNVIDAYGSLRILTKFEKLCPDGSVSQILFVGLGLRRTIARPEYVYCGHHEDNGFYHILPQRAVEVNFKKLPLL